MSEQFDLEKDKFITLVDDEGGEHEFEVLDFIEIDEQTYAIVKAVEEDDEDEALIMRLEKDGEDNYSLVYIEDDEEWDKVAETYDTIMFAEQGGNDDDL